MEQTTEGNNTILDEKTTLSLTSTTTDPALKVMCDEYGKYLDFPELTKSNIQSIEDTVENMLAKLDEFAAFVEVVRQDSAKSLKLFPLLKERCQQIEKNFPAIDALEQMIKVVKGNLDTLDERANSADKLLTALNAEHSQALKWFAKVTNSQTTPPADYKWTPMEFISADQIISTIREAAKNAPPPMHSAFATTPTSPIPPTTPTSPTSATTPATPAPTSSDTPTSS
eukprot:Phypoly_transcript_15848.p1 GENE.Phypoly_transcript_15848~~Phypoly_transcript_15848.p1  ORF type:complete len:227 (-),score=61.31 Phypoly_transcript_15848:126-806(-)